MNHTSWSDKYSKALWWCRMSQCVSWSYANNARRQADFAMPCLVLAVTHVSSMKIWAGWWIITNLIFFENFLKNQIIYELIHTNQFLENFLFSWPKLLRSFQRAKFLYDHAIFFLLLNHSCFSSFVFLLLFLLCDWNCILSMNDIKECGCTWSECMWKKMKSRPNLKNHV